MYLRSFALSMAVALIASSHHADAQIAPAPRLSVDRGVFWTQASGQPPQKRFLLLFSYFGAMRADAGSFRSYLRTAKTTYRFDGIRMFPNWWLDEVGGPCDGGVYDTAPLFDRAGTIDEAAFATMKARLDIAYEEGLIVDLVFAHEPIERPAGADPLPGFRQGIVNTTRRLKTAEYTGPLPAQTGYRHVFFDLQNEFNGPSAGHCKHAFTADQIGSITRMVREADPQRILTASIAYHASAAEAVAMSDAAGLDLIAYHEPRNADWFQQTDDHVAALRAASRDAKPILMSEPPPFESKDRRPVSEWLHAAKAAKASGAAAWCWHTQAFFGWPSKPSLDPSEIAVYSQLFAQLAEVEWPR